MKEYKYFRTLYALTDKNIKITKKTEKMLTDEALIWFKSFGAKFSAHPTEGLWWHWSGSALIFGFGKHNYYYSHVVREYHYAHWGTPSFIAGFEHSKSNPRHASNNPYPEIDDFNNHAWSCGFILGVMGNTPQSFLELFNEVKPEMQ